MNTSQGAGYGLYRSGALCRLSAGSMTAAMKSQRALARNAIKVNVVKISSSEEGRGCIYGIEFPCVYSGNVRTTLESAGIRLSHP